MMKIWHTEKECRIIRLLAGRSNVFLLSKGGEYILVDTGPGFMWEKLRKKLEDLRIYEIKYLILTHSHFDHASNACRIRKKYNAPVVIHENEAPYLEKGDNVAVYGTNTFSRLILTLFNSVFLKFLKYDPCAGDIKIKKELEIDFHGTDLRIIHTPGHSSGSVCVIVDNEIALVGDCVFGVIVPSVYPPFAEDPAELVRSWGKLLQYPCRIYIPSHGNERTRELLSAEYDRRKGLVVVRSRGKR
jgi:hydroxyacylglutathione hydrolase